MPALRDVVHAVKVYLAGVDRDNHRQVYKYAGLSRWAKLAAPVKPKNIRGGV